MDVWPIKCYVPIADETIARSAFGVKGMNASVYINPLPLELCTEVTNTHLSARIRAILARKRSCLWPPDVYTKRPPVFARKPARLHWSNRPVPFSFVERTSTGSSREIAGAEEEAVNLDEPRGKYREEMRGARHSNCVVEARK